MTSVASFAPGEGIASRIAFHLVTRMRPRCVETDLDKVLSVMLLHKHFDLLSQSCQSQFHYVNQGFTACAWFLSIERRSLDDDFFSHCCWRFGFLVVSLFLGWTQRKTNSHLQSEKGIITGTSKRENELRNRMHVDEGQDKTTKEKWQANKLKWNVV